MPALGAVLAAGEPHGLAPLLGSTTDVGAVGYTLGGGMGWLGRRYGLAADSARSFDVVTPDGLELRAAADENPELFWALRGGGAGPFGVVTGMEIELYPVTTVYAGNLLYPIEMAGEVLRRYRDWIRGIDERLTSSVSIMNFPPMEEVPEPIRSQSFVIVRGCWSGDLATGAALIDEWRAWQPPAVDCSADALRRGRSHQQRSRRPGAVRGHDRVVRHAAGRRHRHHRRRHRAGRRASVSCSARSATPAAPSGRRVSAPPTSGVARARCCSSRWRSRPTPPPLHGRSHLDGVRTALAPYVNGSAYLNFLNGAERQQRTAQAFHPAHHQRLVAVKAALDPDGRFRHGFAF